MTKEQKQVREFMWGFGQSCPETPTEEVDLATRVLRAKLMLEEVKETIRDGLGLQVIGGTVGDEIGPVDLVHLADGLADLHYVAYCGTANAFGIDMEPVFKNVHESNMTKFWSEEEVNQIDSELSYSVEKIDHDCYVVKNSSGKVIKSPSYQKASIKTILEDQK